ncbi:MAG: hypothetical protein ACR2PL_21395 [Dehalococcoidia bacterium]
MQRSRSWAAAPSSLVALLGILLLALMAMSGRTRPAIAEQGEDPALLRELAERALSPPVPPPGGQALAVRLLPGSLPADFPSDLPLPDGGQLIGSIVRTQPGPPTGPGGANVDVYFDVPGSSANVFASYQSLLASAGWQPPAPFATPPPHGFQPTTNPINGPFCHDSGGAFVVVNIFPKLDGPSDVRLNVNTSGPGPCPSTVFPGFRPPSGPPGLDLLPALNAPDGVRLLATGAFPAPGSFASTASAETNRSAADLEELFAQQLEAAGWIRVDGQSHGALAWSTWTVSGTEEAQGFLSILEVPGSARRTLQVQVTLPSVLPVLGR